jgi:hypothetical protein
MKTFFQIKRKILHLPFILSSKLQTISVKHCLCRKKICLEKINKNQREFHQELWIKGTKIADEFHTYAHSCCPPKMLSRIEVHVLSIPCSAADNLGLFLAAYHREFQLEKHNEVSHHCGTELQERRQLYEEEMLNSRGDDEDEEHKGSSSAGVHTFEAPGIIG